MAATDSRPVPIKNTAFRAYFDLRLNTGAVNSGAAGLDSEVSLDGGTFADCTNEATEVATSSGHYYLDLTAGEMNADCVVVQVKSSTSGAVTRSITLYPQEAGDIKVDVQALNGSTAAAIAFALSAGLINVCTVTDVGFTPTATQFETAILTDAAADYYKDRIVIFSTGGLQRQASRVVASSLQSGRTRLTVLSLTAAPANAVQFLLI